MYGGNGADTITTPKNGAQCLCGETAFPTETLCATLTEDTIYTLYTIDPDLSGVPGLLEPSHW